MFDTQCWNGDGISLSCLISCECVKQTLTKIQLFDTRNWNGYGIAQSCLIGVGFDTQKTEETRDAVALLRASADLRPQVEVKSNMEREE